MQTVQSLISIASGHLFGVGLGNSIQKFGFLPEQTTDTITGIIGEELGLVGLLVLIALYVVLAWTIFRIALNSREPYGKLLAAGIGSAIGVQAAVNIGAALGVLPLTGVPLPLVSFGGTSLVVVLAGVGIVANIASNRRSYIVASTERQSRARGGGRDGRASARRRSRSLTSSPRAARAVTFVTTPSQVERVAERYPTYALEHARLRAPPAAPRENAVTLRRLAAAAPRVVAHRLGRCGRTSPWAAAATLSGPVVAARRPARRAGAGASRATPTSASPTGCSRRSCRASA